MSITILESASASEDWQLSGEDGNQPASLVVQLRRSVHVLPWFRFLFAEGDHEQVEIVFSTHQVTVTGHGLGALLAAVSTHRVSRMIQPSESEAKFQVRGPNAMSYGGPG